VPAASLHCKHLPPLPLSSLHSAPGTSGKALLTHFWEALLAGLRAGKFKAQRGVGRRIV
jgi:hypothetical protein